MRRLTITFAAIMLTSPAAAQQTPASIVPGVRPAPRPPCTPTAGIVVDRNQKIAPQKLGDLPPASQLYAVYTVVGSCPQPIVLRKGIGGSPQNATPVLRTPPRATRAN